LGEYQYYEFQAIDQPLDAADREALRELSTRARITATSFTNHYEWGDFKGDPQTLMERWFDLHIYLTNWGTRRLMMRLPAQLVQRSSLDVYLSDVDWVEVWEKGENLIVDMYRDEVEQGYDDWDDESGRLAALAPLRADVISGDLRLFYLLWLTALEDGVLEVDETEPLAGIGSLTGALVGAAEFFGIDRDLLQAAAEGREYADKASSTGVTRNFIAEIPENEKTELLIRVVDGEPHVATELKARLRTQGHRFPSTVPRTVRCLTARATAIRQSRECADAARQVAERRRLAEDEKKVRRKHLDDLKRKGEGIWLKVEAEINRRSASSYDRAANLLFDLQTIAEEQETLADFIHHVEDISERHARKGRFIERLTGLRKR
jgi:hypothetical protein